ELIAEPPAGAAGAAGQAVEEVRPGLEERRLERRGGRGDAGGGGGPVGPPARGAPPPPPPRRGAPPPPPARPPRRTPRPAAPRRLGEELAAPGAATLREWWEGRSRRGDQLAAAQLLHAVLLGATAAAHAGPDWGELAGCLARDVAEDGTFGWRLSDPAPAAGQPF